MAAKRYRCVQCRSSIDTDLHECPFCGEADPLRYRRTRTRTALVGTLAILAALALMAFVVLP